MTFADFRVVMTPVNYKPPVVSAAFWADVPDFSSPLLGAKKSPYAASKHQEWTWKRATNCFQCVQFLTLQCIVKRATNLKERIGCSSDPEHDAPPQAKAVVSRVTSAPSLAFNIRQNPGFHRTTLRPYYESQPVSNVVLGLASGSSGYARRAVQLGCSELVETEHGAFFSMPNPKYHWTPEAAFNDERKARFVAWWIHPDLCAMLKSWPEPRYCGKWLQILFIVQVWLRCTKMPAEQRALALYTALTGKAWVYAKELDLDIMGSEHGVSYFLGWIQTRFMEVEVSKVSQMMSDLFRRCRRKPEQSVRDFNVEFERLVLRLREVQCELPPLVKAWLYLDRLKLTEGEELALLSSVNNQYDVKKLQQAALVQDRSIRCWMPLLSAPSNISRGCLESLCQLLMFQRAFTILFDRSIARSTCRFESIPVTCAQVKGEEWTCSGWVICQSMAGTASRCQRLSCQHQGRPQIRQLGEPPVDLELVGTGCAMLRDELRPGLIHEVCQPGLSPLSVVRQDEAAIQRLRAAAERLTSSEPFECARWASILDLQVASFRTLDDLKAISKAQVPVRGCDEASAKWARLEFVGVKRFDEFLQVST
eukprot:g1228.t1